MKPFISLVFTLSFCLFMLTCQAKTIDPYNVLGVERNASQREIQKAFHKLSLQYHPDKNKNKSAQEKFAEINNAYEILSDEEKRKNYDLYGDEKGNPGFDAGYPGDQHGYTHFTSGGHGQNRFTFRPGEWQNMGGQRGSRSFSFSFGGPSSQNSFDFGMGDIFSNLFGGDVGGSQFGGFSGGSTTSNNRFKSGSRSSSRSIKAINSQFFKKGIADQGKTWLLLSLTPSLKGLQYYESVVQEVADSLEGAVKAGSINCESETSFCKELGIRPQRAPRLFVYSLSRDKGSLVEFSDDLVAKNLKSFCQDHLPRVSTRIDLKQLESLSNGGKNFPIVVLLSTKKNTPVIWRVLSGLYHKQFIFYDVEVHDARDAVVRKLGVDALPAIVGFSSNGEKHILHTGISVKDIKSAVHDLSVLLDGFAKKNRKADSSRTKKGKSDYDDKQIPLLTRSNFDAFCGEKNPVCIIGAFRSSKSREKLESILTMVYRKSLSRRKNSLTGSKDSISYALLDANAQPGFLNALDKSGFKSSDRLLLAYKPRKGKFVAYKGEINAEEVERFISAVLNGDVQFTKTRQKPVVK